MVEYCGRPDNFEEMIFNGFGVIGPDDILIHLGDICIGSDAECHEEFIMSINCKKILVRGNHDKKSIHWYLGHGWDWVCESMSMQYGGKRILFSHMPMVWDGYWDINIHGHFHNANHRRYEAELNGDLLKGQKLLALEYNNYQLWNLDKIINK